jgi:Cys-rich protein (TIGR01571 family)
MSEFQHGLCGCFDDCGICLLTYFVPCYVVGVTAEAVGESCILCCILAITPAGICTIPYVRSRVRDQQNISGSFVGDFIVTLCCSLCVIAQMRQETSQMGGRGISMERE